MGAIDRITKVALLQFNCDSQNKQDSLDLAEEFVNRAMEQRPSTDLLVMPECFNSRYSASEFRANSEPIPHGPTTMLLKKLATKYHVNIIGGSFPELDDDKVYNTSIVLDRTGNIVAKHRKTHLFDVDIPGKLVFKESSILSPGNKATVFHLDDIGTFGLGICYDVRFPELCTIASRNGAGILVFPAAFSTTTGKYWRPLAIARAIDNQCFVLMNGAERIPAANYQCYGHSMVVDPSGHVMVEAGPGPDILYADLEPEIKEREKAYIPIDKQRRFDVYPDVSKGACFSAM